MRIRRHTSDVKLHVNVGRAKESRPVDVAQMRMTVATFSIPRVLGRPDRRTNQEPTTVDAIHAQTLIAMTGVLSMQYSTPTGACDVA